jgi:hypothetical protein
MENKQMYVITMSAGQYEDSYTNVLFVTDDFEKGEAYVNKKNSICQSCKEKAESFQKNDIKAWFLANPRPEIVQPVLLPVPKWKSDEKITPEMRADRKRIQKENDATLAKVREPLLQWGKKQQEFTSEWLKNNLTDEEAEMYSKIDDNVWEIEPVAWL